MGRLPARESAGARPAHLPTPARLPQFGCEANIRPSSLEWSSFSYRAFPGFRIRDSGLKRLPARGYTLNLFRVSDVGYGVFTRPRVNSRASSPSTDTSSSPAIRVSSEHSPEFARVVQFFVSSFPGFGIRDPGLKHLPARGYTLSLFRVSDVGCEAFTRPRVKFRASRPSTDTSSSPGIWVWSKNLPEFTRMVQFFVSRLSGSLFS